MKTLTSSFFFSLLVVVASFTACKKDKPIDTKAVIANLGNNVILKTYEDLNNKAAQLQSAIQALITNTTDINLQAARQAWVAARSPWEQSEGFLFGPVEQEGLDPSLDSWPVNVTDFNAILADTQTITAATLLTGEGTLRGFHTIEYLLWGEHSNKIASNFTARELEYLQVCTQLLVTDAQNLYNLWQPAGGNFANTLQNAGTSGNPYLNDKSVLVEFMNAMIGISDEVANAKITEPFDARDLSLEESRFSAASKTDFVANIQSIKNIYTGVYGTNGNGLGISDYVLAKNKDLNTRFVGELDAAMTAIQNIPVSFSDAIFNNREAIEDAKAKTNIIQATLRNDIFPIISAL